MPSFRLPRTLLLLTGLLTVASLLIASPLYAQTGSLEGRVTNGGTGAPLPGVNIVAHGPDGRTGTSTDAEGRYQVRGLTPGLYQLAATAVGYERSTRDVRVQAGRPATADVQLSPQPCGLNEVVVSATRSQEQLSTVSASITVVGPEELETQTTLTSDLGDMLAQTVPGLAQRAVRLRGERLAHREPRSSVLKF